MTYITDVMLKPFEEFEKGMQELIEEFVQHKKVGKKLFFIGNGGSAAIAIHNTADFMKNGGMKTVSMYDGATLTCLGNDYGYEHVFEKQIARLGDEEDMLVAISSSGNSSNIVKGITAALDRNMKVVTFSGFETHNAIRQMGNYNVYVPCKQYGIVESIHGMLLQAIVDMVSEWNEADDE